MLRPLRAPCLCFRRARACQQGWQGVRIAGKHGRGAGTSSALRANPLRTESCAALRGSIALLTAPGPVVVRRRSWGRASTRSSFSGTAGVWTRLRTTTSTSRFRPARRSLGDPSAAHASTAGLAAYCHCDGSAWARATGMLHAVCGGVARWDVAGGGNVLLLAFSRVGHCQCTVYTDALCTI